MRTPNPDPISNPEWLRNGSDSRSVILHAGPVMRFTRGLGLAAALMCGAAVCLTLAAALQTGSQLAAALALAAVAMFILAAVVVPRSLRQIIRELHLLRAILDTLPQFIYVKDTQGRYIFNNRASRQGLTGDEGRSIAGKTDADFFPPEHAAMWMAEERAILASGKPVINREAESIYVVTGETFWVTSSKIPLYDERGRLVGLVGVGHDITARKAMEDALRASESRYRMLAETVTDVIWTMDLDGRLTYVSPSVEKLCGYTPEEVMAQPLEEILTPSSLALVRQALAEWRAHATTGSGHPQIPVEIEQPRKDGSTVWTEVLTSPILDAQGRVTGILGVTRDVTPRRQIEAQRLELAVERERLGMLQRFITNLSHDLMTPLTILKSGIYLLEKQDAPERRAVLLSRMSSQTQRLEKMIQDMLLQMRLERNIEDEFVFEPCCVDALIYRLTADFQPLAASRNQTLECKPAAMSWIIPADENKLARAFANLLDNGLRYTPDGGCVTISFEPDGAGGVIVEVRDTGQGISLRDLPHIFERFYRGAAHRPSDGGAGLGLSIAQKIIEAHGGKITVDSEPGSGSAFRVWLPPPEVRVQRVKSVS